MIVDDRQEAVEPERLLLVLDEPRGGQRAAGGLGGRAHRHHPALHGSTTARPNRATLLRLQACAGCTSPHPKGRSSAAPRDRRGSIAHRTDEFSTPVCVLPAKLRLGRGSVESRWPPRPFSRRDTHRDGASRRQDGTANAPPSGVYVPVSVPPSASMAPASTSQRVTICSLTRSLSPVGAVSDGT